MSNMLTQKEQMLLQDQKSHEELCILKYQKYANQAQDSQLKQLFNSYATKEQEHLNTINQILNGQVPNVNQQQGQQQSQQSGQGQQGQSSNQSINQNTSQNMGQGMYNKQDAMLCQDALTTEKYVSGTYDTAIFEFTNTSIRQVLNHIQKEEQQHGEGIFNYMQAKGMYNAQ